MAEVIKNYLIRGRRCFDIYRLEPTSEEVDSHRSVEAQEWIDGVHEALLFMGLCGEDSYPYIDWGQPESEDSVRRAFVRAVSGEAKAFIVNGMCDQKYWE